MNILVTGGAGFIGSSLSKELLKTGNRVIAIDNFNNYYNPLFKKENVADIKNKRFRIIKADITKPNELKKIFAKYKFDKIVHLAARAGVRDSLRRPGLFLKTNLQGTFNILEKAREYGIKDFIFAGTSAVYGNDTVAPFKEDSLCIKPLNPYAMSKRAGELLCYTYHNLYGINMTILRFFTVYGPKGRPDMSIYIFTESMLAGKKIKIFGDGTAERDFTYIEDIVSGIILALKKPFPFEIINLGGARPIQVLKMLRLLEKITGKKAQIVYEKPIVGESRATNANISKARKLLGYKVTTPIEIGLNSFVKWYKKNRLKN
jgi:UDP-glucuronate 4-epimerase